MRQHAALAGCIPAAGIPAQAVNEKFHPVAQAIVFGDQLGLAPVQRRLGVMAGEVATVGVGLQRRTASGIQRIELGHASLQPQVRTRCGPLLERKAARHAGALRGGAHHGQAGERHHQQHDQCDQKYDTALPGLPAGPGAMTCG